jgi:hypothetical protein
MPTLWLAAVAAILAGVSFFLPVFQVGGYVYRMIDSFGGRGQFAAAVVVPVILAVSALSLTGAFAVRAFSAAALATASLVPLDHLTEAWRRGDPEVFPSLFQVRYGFFVGLVAVIGGSIVFLALLRGVLKGQTTKVDRVSSGVIGVAAVGLMIAIVGQVVESSKEHPWEMPLWPQIGRWWELLVTAAVCAVAVRRVSATSLAAAIAVSIARAVATAQELAAVSGLEDDPAVSTTVTLVGFAMVAIALSVTLVRGMSADSVERRV